MCICCRGKQFPYAFAHLFGASVHGKKPISGLFALADRVELSYNGRASRDIIDFYRTF